MELNFDYTSDGFSSTALQPQLHLGKPALPWVDQDNLGYRATTTKEMPYGTLIRLLKLMISLHRQHLHER